MPASVRQMRHPGRSVGVRPRISPWLCPPCRAALATGAWAEHLCVGGPGRNVCAGRAGCLRWRGPRPWRPVSDRDDGGGDTARNRVVFDGRGAAVLPRPQPVHTHYLLGAVEAHFEDTGEVLDPAGQLALDSHVPIGRTARAFDAARAAGCRLSLDDAYAPLR